MGRFCETCAALVARAQALMKAKTKKGKRKHRALPQLSDEERKKRGDRLRNWHAANREKHAENASKAGSHRIQQVNLKNAGFIPTGLMAELNGAPPHPDQDPNLHPVKSKPVKAANGEKVKPVTVKQAVDRELAERELARRKLIRFILRNNPKYKAGWFHIDLCERLEKFMKDVEDGLSPRLILCTPPRHGKSTAVSQEFPAFFFGHHPDWEIIAASYGADLANDFSAKVQDRIKSEEYQTLFPATLLRPGRESIAQWKLTKDGGYIAAGVGGSVTGKGAHALLIDDPLKNREDAESATIRKQLWEWYTSTAYTRLAPGGGVCIIQTRWHDDDLVGKLLTEMGVAERQMKDTGVWPADADRWEVVSYPAIAVEDEVYRMRGEPLHPERYALSQLLKIKRTLGPRDWSALYQQNPAPEDGGYFAKESIRYVDTLPQVGDMAIYAAGDMAISKKDSADFTVIGVVGITANDDIYLLDVRRERWDSMEIIDQLFDVQKTWHPKIIGLEEGQITKAIGPFLDKRIQEEKMYSMVIEPLKIGKRDKESRAQPIRGRMKQGKVFIPKNAPWTGTVVNELLRFPNGLKDDCVDMLAWIGQMLMEMNLAYKPTAKAGSWRDKLKVTSGPSVNDAMAA